MYLIRSLRHAKNPLFEKPQSYATWINENGAVIVEQKCSKAKLNRALKCLKWNLTQVGWREMRASSNMERIRF